MMIRASNCTPPLPTPPADEMLLQRYNKTPPKIFKDVEASATSTACVMGYTTVPLRKLRLAMEFKKDIMTRARESFTQAARNSISLSVTSVYDTDQLQICS